MNDNRHQEYLTELKRHKWKIVDFEKGYWNCIHPVGEYSTCGKYKNGLTRLIPQGEINYPENYAKNRDFWICPEHLSFYKIDKTYESK